MGGIHSGSGVELTSYQFTLTSYQFTLTYQVFADDNKMYLSHTSSIIHQPSRHSWLLLGTYHSSLMTHFTAIVLF